MSDFERHKALLLEFALSQPYLDGDFEGAVSFLGAHLIDHLDVDKVFVWVLAPGDDSGRIVGACHRNGPSGSSHAAPEPATIRQIMTDHALVWSGRDAAPFAHSEQSPPASLMAASGLYTPICVRGKLSGALCLEMLSKCRPWSRDEAELCVMLARQLGLLYAADSAREPQSDILRTGEVYRRAIAAAGAAPYIEAYTPHAYTFMGEQITALTGYTPEVFTPELLKRIVQKYVTRGPASGLEFEEAVERSRRGEFDYWQCDLEILTKSGDIRWIADISVEIMGSGGRSTGSIGLITDITDRVQKEEEIRRVEEVYRRAIAAAGAIPYVESRSPEWKYTFLDARLAELTGYPLEQISPAFLAEITVRDVVLGDNTGYSKEEARARTHRGDVPIWLSDFSVRTRDGGTLWLSDASVEIFGPDGSSIGSLGLLQDITERKRAETVLRESEAKYRRIVDTANEGIWVSDENRITTFVNARMGEMFGLPPAEMIGRSVEDFLFPEDVPAFLAQWDNRARGLPGNYALRWRRRDGTEIWATVSATSILDEEGVFQGSCAMLTDITERRRAAAELEHIHTYARCLLWHAEVFLDQGVYQWTITVPNEEAAQRYLPLRLKPGQRYFDALIESRTEFAEGDEKQLATNCERAFANGTPSYHQEYRIRIATGEIRWLYEDAYIQALAPARWRVVGVCTDVTERKRAEDAVRLSEAQLLATLENTPNVAIQWYDEQGRVQYWNHASEELYGWTAAEAVGKTLDMLIHTPEEAAEFRHILEGIQSTGRPFGPYEASVTSRDGRQGWVMATTFGIPMSGGRTGFVCMDVDITDRKKADEALRQSESRFRVLVENAPEAIVVLDAESRLFVDCNENACSLFGLTRDSLLQLGPVELSPPIQPDGRTSQELAQEKIRIVLEGSSARFEWMHQNANGRDFPCEVYLSRLPSVTGFLMRGSIFDISERKRVEAEQERLHEHLVQAQKMESVGRLAGGVAHDFNNMLGVILGHVELALDTIDNAHVLHTDLLEIQKAAVRSADLTRQLLAFARKQTAAPKVLDLNEAVEGMLKMLRRLIGEDIDLVWNPAHSVWPIRVDPVQIDQILANLCVNARDAIAGVGNVTIETGVVSFGQPAWGNHTDAAPGDYVLLTVRDNGCGVDKDVIAHMFEPFFTTKGLGEGTGLGLATVYGIVKQNNGYIDVQSAPGTGTEFRIYLPRCTGRNAPEQVVIPADATCPGNETVLLVEDETGLLNLARIMLEKQGYRVLAAGSPHEALRLAEEHAGDIHILMTDVVMPEMNGRDLARRLLSLYPDMKRLFMSGYTADVIAQNGVLEDGVHFLQKPFSFDALRLKMREALDHG